MVRKIENVKKAVILCLVVFLSVITQAADTDPIQALIEKGELKEALNLTQQLLVKDQDNVNYLFLKGLILTRQNKLEESRDVFVQLTEQYPELPEPYNNLAVVYAALGDFTNARIALEKAINTHPSYATAYENMGDIYAKMASNAYNSALEIDGGNEAAREKLSLVGALFSVQENEQTSIAIANRKEIQRTEARLDELEKKLSSVNKQNREQEARAKELKGELSLLDKQREDSISQSQQEQERIQQQIQLAKLQLQQSRIEQEQSFSTISKRNQEQEARAEEIKVELSRLEKQRQEAISQSQQEREGRLRQIKQADLQLQQTKAELAQLEQQKLQLNAQTNRKIPLTQQEQQVVEKDLDDVIKSVMGWAAYWSARNIDGYLSSYSDSYSPESGISRDQWAEQRKTRLIRPRYIQVEIEEPRVTMMGEEHAQVNFFQNYRSDTYSDRIKKTLLMKLENKQWLIVEEKAN